MKINGQNLDKKSLNFGQKGIDKWTFICYNILINKEIFPESEVKMSNINLSRYRFSVPFADTVVHDWIHSQSNLSFSLRVLIKAFVKEYGNQDATCLELGETPKKRGRPSNAMRSQLEDLDKSEAVENSVNNIENTVNTEIIETETAEKKEEVKTVKAIEKPVEPAVPDSNSDNSDDDGFVDPEDLF